MWERIHQVNWYKKGVPSAESSRSVRGLGKGVSGKPYPRLCNATRPRLAGALCSGYLKWLIFSMALLPVPEIYSSASKSYSNLFQSATHSMNGNCTLKYAFPITPIFPARQTDNQPSLQTPLHINSHKSSPTKQWWISLCVGLCGAAAAWWSCCPSRTSSLTGGHHLSI